MSSVLFVYESNMPTVTSLQETFMRAFIGYNLTVSFNQLMQIVPSDIDNNDVIVFIRPTNTLSSAIAKKASKAGCTIVTFCDDDLLNYKPVPPWRLKGLKNVLALSDVIWSSNQHLCEKYKKYTLKGRTARIDTIVNKSDLSNMSYADETEFNRPVQIVYAANPMHVLQFNKYILPVMHQIVERYAGKISMTFISVKPDLSKYEDRINIRYVNGMPLRKYREFMEERRFDIGLSPLEENEFTKYKYFNKYIEYTISGVAGVYSNVEPYTTVIKDRKNGFLANNNGDSWYETLCVAIDDAVLRKSCLCEAREHLLNDFSEERILDKLFNDIPELRSPKADRHSCETFTKAKISYLILRMFDWAYLSLYYLTKTGIRGFINKVKTHVSERKAYKY